MRENCLNLIDGSEGILFGGAEQEGGSAVNRRHCGGTFSTR